MATSYRATPCFQLENVERSNLSSQNRNSKRKVNNDNLVYLKLYIHLILNMIKNEFISTYMPKLEF